MDVVILTLVCAAALTLAVLAIVHWGGAVAEREPLPPPGGRAGAVATRMARSIGIAAVAGPVAGVLVAGLGSRLVMRLLAATSGPDAQGRLTEAEERVGEITLGGTLGLLLFVGLLGGLAGGVAYLLVRSFVPGSARIRGLVTGLLLLGLARIDPLDPDNIDFQLLEPTWLATVSIAALFPLFGMTLAAIFEHLARAWRDLTGWRRAAGYLPALVFLPAAVFAVMAVLAAWIDTAVSGRARGARAAHTVGRVVLIAAVAAGLLWSGSGVVDILTA